MNEVFQGKVSIQDIIKKKNTIELEGNNGVIRVGGSGNQGSIEINNGDGKKRAWINYDGVYLYGPTGSHSIYLYGQSGRIEVGGGGGLKGSIGIYDGADHETIHLNGQAPNAAANISLIGVGGNGARGSIEVYKETGKKMAWLYPDMLGLIGSVYLYNAAGNHSIYLHGESSRIEVGGSGLGGIISIFDGSDKEKIRIDGNSGDIILQGADCAEEFDVIELDEFGPGTVMVIGQDGKLCPSEKPFDKRVAGVISGEKDYRPGIVLDKRPSEKRRLPIALTGKTYCKVDAQESPIELGDLLTTSSIQGHAMKANDPLRAFGAVIGKALASLSDGTGLIPILVALQ
jgi:hypothetical protein